MVVKSSFKDKRKAERLPSCFQVTYSDGKYFYTECLRDISSGGAQIEAARPQEVGTEITMTLDSEPPIKLKGIVRWVKKAGLRYQMGVQFKKVEPEQEAKIREIIQCLFWETYRR